MRYKRVILKLSGGAVSGDLPSGFDPDALDFIASEVLELRSLGVEIGLVIGGGNIFKGTLGAQWGIERAEADNIGMMATVINSLMLRGVISAKSDVEVRVMTAIPINTVAEPYIRLRAAHHMVRGYLVILAGGIGNPYVTTDYTGVQRALELRAEAILFAKHRADGVYTDDPNTNAEARRYRKVNYTTVIGRNLGALDQAAVLLARDNALPIHVFDFDNGGSMRRILEGEDVGTLNAQVPVDEMEA